MRHTTVFYIEIEFVISIHAPFVGCDAIQLLWLPNSLNFNPHTHRGVRLLTSWSTFSFVTVFQSTHPSWGATLHCKEVIPLVFSISIHAPIVGCDVVCNKADITLTIISIHAPIVGCDLKKTAPTDTLQISIHAPIVGCDRGIKTDTKCKQNFNPRTHRGVRQSLSMTLSSY